MRKLILALLLASSTAQAITTNNFTNSVTIVRASAGHADAVRRSDLSPPGSGGLLWSSGSNNISIGGNITVPVNFLNNVTYTEVVNISTQVYIGTTTNFVAQTVYSTNYSYQYEVMIRERATNIIDVIGGWVFNNSFLNGTNMAYLSTPHFTDTKGGSLVATGTWNFAGATVLGLGTSSISTSDVQGIVTAYGYATPAVTNGLLKNAGGVLTKSGDTVSLSTNGWVFGTSGAITNETDPVFVAVSNSYYLASNPSLYVTASVTNGLQIAGAYVTASVTNGLATRAAVALKADSNKTVSVAINGVTNSVTVGLGGVIDLGTLATVTGSVSYASNAGSLNGITGGSYALTNQLMKFTIGLPAGAALVYGSTNDALLAGVTGNNAYWDELQYNDTTQQRARWVIPPTSTTRYLGGAVTNKIYWRGTSTVGAVVWQMAYVGLTNGGLSDLAYQNQTIGSNTVSSVASNINLTTIVLVPTNCPVGSPWAIELQRLPANAADTMVNDARVISIGVNE